MFRCILPAIGMVFFCIGPAPAADKDKSAAPAPVIHVVIVHVKPDAPAGAADEIIADAHQMLAKVPSVRDLAAGKPAKKSSPRKDPEIGSEIRPDRARTDYEVGLMLRFDDLQGLEAYQKHPLHLKFVEKHGKNVQLEKLTVFDFVDERK